MRAGSSRGRDGPCEPPRAQIPTCPIRAPGSYLGWVTAKRASGSRFSGRAQPGTENPRSSRLFWPSDSAAFSTSATRYGNRPLRVHFGADSIVSSSSATSPANQLPRKWGATQRAGARRNGPRRTPVLMIKEAGAMRHNEATQRPKGISKQRGCGSACAHYRAHPVRSTWDFWPARCRPTRTQPGKPLSQPGNDGGRRIVPPGVV
jgi:hypothetical protein